MKRTTWLAGVMAMTAASVAMLGATVQPDQGLPGTRDAIEKAVEQAAADAVSQVLRTLPSGIDTIGLGPLFNDGDRFAAGVVEHALIQAATAQGLKVVTRRDADWERLTGEWKFTEDNFDVMPAQLLPRFREVLPAGAILWGNVTRVGLDDSGYKGQASLQLWMANVASGEIVGSGSGRGLVWIDPETAVLGLTHRPWFWPVVIVGVVLAVVVLVIMIPLRRKFALAAKPRIIER